MPTQSTKTLVYVLTAVLVLAFVLRIWGVWFGLPYTFHNDEGFEVVRALQLGAGEFNFARIGKGGYYYVLFVEYGFLYLCLLVSGAVSSANDFARLYVQDPTLFYLVGRATTALLGTLTVYFVYRLGEQAFGRLAGLLGAAFLAFNVLHAYLSHLITVDVPMALLITITLFFASRLVTDYRRGDYLLAALFAALAMTTKIPAVLVLLPLLIAHFVVVRQRGGRASEYFLAVPFLQAVVVFVGVYVLATPGIVLHFGDVVSGMAGNFAGDVDPAELTDDGGLDPRSKLANTNLFVFYASVIAESMTLPVLLAALAGFAYAIYRRSATDVMLLAYGVIYFLAIASSNDPHLFFPRYMAPLLPLLCVLAGRVVAVGIEKWAPARQAQAAAIVILVMAVLPVTRIVEANVLLTRTDTRILAKDWFEANVEPGARVLIEGYQVNVSAATVPLQNSAENIRSGMQEFRERGESGKVTYFRYKLEALGDRTYDLYTVQQGGEIGNLDEYKELGIEYFVLRPDAYVGSRRQYEWPELVASLRADPGVELVGRFDPEESSGPGPLIEIYRLSLSGNVSDDPAVQGEPDEPGQAPTLMDVGSVP